MAQELVDGEFWLPPEFLTDDDLFMDFSKNDSFKKERTDFSYGIGNFSGFNSDLSSPVESVVGSNETDSDEDEFITGLTRKIASSTLQDSTAKGCKLSGSPQSTLHRAGPGSSRGSPNCLSQVSSPPDCKKAVGFDLLYAAAEEVARMRKIEGHKMFNSNQFLTPAQKPDPVAVPVKNPNYTSGFYPNQVQTHISYQQFQFQQQQQLMKGVFGFQNGRVNLGERNKPGLNVAAWPTLQQSQQVQNRPGSGMRAGFLGETGPKKERTGTGVFLPRRVESNPTQTRKKQAGCPILLPGKVVHALNLNLDSVDSSSQPRQNGRLTTEHDVALKQRSNVISTQDRRIMRPQAVMNQQELRLPQEWTY